MSSPMLVPDGFIGRVLQEFGIQWTHVAILSGVGFSAFGLDKYLHPGIWILGTMAGFSVVYFFRRQITSRFPLVFVCALPLLVASVGFPAFVLRARHVNLLDYLEKNRTIGTVYLSLVVIIPIACMIASYRKQEDIFGGPYPEPLAEAIKAHIASGKFYREQQYYRINVVDADDATVTFETELGYTLVNRTRIAQQWTGGFASRAREVEYLTAEVDGRQIDTHDPDYRTERGLQVTASVPGRGSVQLRFTARETFSQTSSELYTAYMPSTSLRLELTNLHEDGVRIAVESLLPEKVLPEIGNGRTIYNTTSGVLPYQGFRLHWKAP